MRSIVISTGRNIGTEPMPAEQWKRFARAVSWAAEDKGFDVLTVADVLFNGGEEWGSEETRLHVLGGDGDLEALRKRLSYIMTRFGQEAYALTIGEVSFIPASGQASA